jgi:hypothetical protein
LTKNILAQAGVGPYTVNRPHKNWNMQCPVQQ